MSYLLDVLGATAIGGFVILLILEINIQMNSANNEMILTTYTQVSAVATSEIIRYDFYKIGYRITGDKIILADSAGLKYKTDIDNNGTEDSVYYYTGTTGDLSTTTNPNDMPLYRLLNNNSPNLMSVASTFNLTYYDSIGTILSYASLNTQANRNKIRSFKVNIMFESNDPIDGIYQGVDFQRIITPKNLK